MNYKPPMPKEYEINQDKTLYKQVVQEMPPRNLYQGGYNPNPSLKLAVKLDKQTTLPTPLYAPKFQTILVERLREVLKARGGRGLIGLRR